MNYSKLLPVTAIVVAIFSAQNADARIGRPDKIPNGSVNSCSNCHLNPNGGGTRTPFGQAVFIKIGGTSQNVDFWDAALAQADSDGDGFTNGEELGDPDGNFMNLGPANAVSNPGDASSTPPQPNNAPVFNSSPGTTAYIGEAYSYQATGFDFEGHALTFSKVAGPVWLSVSGSGLVSGTPPNGSSGDVSVSLRVTDNGTPNLSGTQNYTLSVSASYAGFQNLQFNLPEDAAIAAPDQDPDNDDIPNIAEYALRLNPNQTDSIDVLETPTFTGNGQMQFVLQVRNDDPSLSIQLEASGEVPFAAPAVIDPVVTDPNGSDGLETWTFTDDVSSESIGQRFGRFKFELAQ